jgi:hypothetical protein
MSINLVPEDASPKSSYWVAELGRDRDLREREPDRPATGKDRFATPGASIREMVPDEPLPRDRG